MLEAFHGRCPVCGFGPMFVRVRIKSPFGAAWEMCTSCGFAFLDPDHGAPPVEGEEAWERLFGENAERRRMELYIYTLWTDEIVEPEIGSHRVFRGARYWEAVGRHRERIKAGRAKVYTPGDIPSENMLEISMTLLT